MNLQYCPHFEWKPCLKCAFRTYLYGMPISYDHFCKKCFILPSTDSCVSCRHMYFVRCGENEAGCYRPDKDLTIATQQEEKSFWNQLFNKIYCFNPIDDYKLYEKRVEGRRKCDRSSSWIDPNKYTPEYAYERAFVQ